MFTYEMFNTNSGWLLKDDVQVCILRKHEVAAYIAKAERIDAEDKAYAAELLAARKASVSEYLASRDARPASTQISLF